MNFMRLHIGDWATRLDEFDVTVEGTYLRLLRWYYVHETPLPLDMTRLREIVHARTRLQCKALRHVLKTFFTCEQDGYHNERTDLEVVRVHVTDDQTAVTRIVNRVRQNRCRSRRQLLFTTLREAGIHARSNLTIVELVDLCTSSGLPLPVTVPVTAPVTRDSHVLNSPYPVLLPSVASGAGAPACAREEDAEPPQASAAGLACRAMKRAGIADVNPSHPLLLRLLDAGVTEDELRIAAAESATKGKGFAYALAVVEGRRRDAAKAGTVPDAAPSVSTFLAAIRRARGAAQ